MELKGKVALVTGAASGIGRAMATVFGQAGLKVVAADISAERLAVTTQAMKAAGVEGFTAQLDVRDRAGWEALVERVWAELGPVQLLCNNAGVTATPKPFLETTVEAFDWVVNTNLAGALHGSQVVARRLVAEGLSGHIVNTASVQGIYAAPNFSPYNASKFAVVGLTETLAMELGPHGISVSVLCPGPTKGDIMKNSAEIAPDIVAPPTGRAREGFDWLFMPPEETAGIVLEGVKAGRFYIFTHGEYRPVIAAREAAVAGALWDADPERTAKINEIEAEPMAFYQGLVG